MSSKKYMIDGIGEVFKKDLPNLLTVAVSPSHMDGLEVKGFIYDPDGQKVAGTRHGVPFIVKVKYSLYGDYAYFTVHGWRYRLDEIIRV